MKKIQDFNKNIVTSPQHIFGGKTEKGTGAHDDCGEYEDIWHDNNDDSAINSGDTVCINPDYSGAECANEDECGN